MRPLFHPSPEDVTVEAILHALSDPVRAQIFAGVASADCAQICSAFADVSDRPVPKSTLSQHFKVLREAGLVRSERHGVEVRNTARLGELRERFGPLIEAIMQAHAKQQCETRAKAG
ncbi:ArsR/SmtB family transcription factor [Hansschlegelia plantiphila]|uniref:Transcriptional regulator n=1 Tax=Hansschlegelia plantiphila TaxID=374655 RepID=A0A9W6MUF2_9HYPH|nr:helix-turn-helix domain-containing protein [Hansschlegelia plantiphila]GLK66761.1 transcriptional regulator [Hansschlegelia plantiphila]